MYLVDYHIHTLLCNHASGTMDECVRRAVELNLNEIAFLDHLTLRESDHENSMSEAEVGFYFAAIMRLKRKYADRITIKAGLEIDHDPLHRGLARAVVERFSFDVITSSVHFSDEYNFVSRRAARKNINVTDDDWAKFYIEALWEMLEEPYFDVVGHVDVFKKFGRIYRYGVLDLFGEIFIRMANLGLVMELNTSGLDHKAEEFYPGPYLLKMARDRGVEITPGSDAHSPAEVGRHLQTALNLASEAGYTDFAVFDKRAKRLVPFLQE